MMHYGEKLMNKFVTRIGDQTQASGDKVIDASDMTFFDDMEVECWRLFLKYCNYFEIDVNAGEFDVDFCVAKEIQECVLKQFSDAGFKFDFGNIEG